MISASVGANSSLLVEPARDLVFVLEPRNAYSEGVKAAMCLQNISTRKHVVFKIRTTNPDMFTVKPAQGMVAPGETLQIVITLVPKSCAKIAAMAPEAREEVVERFLVQSFDRAENLRPDDISDYSAFWKRIPRDWITDIKLTCKFLMWIPQQVEVPAPDMLMMALHPRVRPTPTLTLDPNQPEWNIDKMLTQVNELRVEANVNVPRSPSHDPMGMLTSPDDGFESMSSSNSSATYSGDERDELEVEAMPTYAIHPRDILVYHVTSMGKMMATSPVFITNRSKQYGLAFKIKTTNHAGYYVKPCRGLVAFNTTQRIEVYMCSKWGEAFDAAEREQKDKLMIETMFVDTDTCMQIKQLNDEQRKNDIAELWKAPTAPTEKTILQTQIIMECNEDDEDSIKVTSSPDSSRGAEASADGNDAVVIGVGRSRGSIPLVHEARDHLRGPIDLALDQRRRNSLQGFVTDPGLEPSRPADGNVHGAEDHLPEQPEHDDGDDYLVRQSWAERPTEARRTSNGQKFFFI
ncbi:TPA: hypothetical protein N0F65_006933 [Lagenidium giganteum]|uniref:MSP domain-containing protein n=1 Tax=Lagenidium giganteum TaxID=4803 RepID=A0AAV2ZBV8_9STRA|nr:TPA: hypothetical protein N0F65_006933 [Lagenidium giganteum]